MVISHAIRDVVTERKTECDFMQGAEPCKSDWTSENRKSYQFIYYKGRQLSFFRYLILYRLRWYLANFTGLQKTRFYLKKLSHGLKRFT